MRRRRFGRPPSGFADPRPRPTTLRHCDDQAGWDRIYANRHGTTGPDRHGPPRDHVFLGRGRLGFLGGLLIQPRPHRVVRAADPVAPAVDDSTDAVGSKQVVRRR